MDNAAKQLILIDLFEILRYKHLNFSFKDLTYVIEEFKDVLPNNQQNHVKNMVKLINYRNNNRVPWGHYWIHSELHGLYDFGLTKKPFLSQTFNQKSLVLESVQNAIFEKKKINITQNIVYNEIIIDTGTNKIFKFDDLYADGMYFDLVVNEKVKANLILDILSNIIDLKLDSNLIFGVKIEDEYLVEKGLLKSLKALQSEGFVTEKFITHAKYQIDFWQDFKFKLESHSILLDK